MKKKYRIICGEKISKNLLNNSPSKQMYSFSKSERFPPILSSSTSSISYKQFYNIPPIRDNRSCSFGYGNKIDFSKESKDKSKVYYNIKSIFSKNSGSPFYSFGIGRDLIYINKINNKNFPGPGQYNLIKPFGYSAKKFSIYSKILDNEINNKKNFPGPGNYKNNLGISTKGLYPISEMKNIHSLNFGKNSDDRFSYLNKIENLNVPGPGNYNQKSLLGKIFNSRYKSNNAYTFSHKIKYVDSRENFPGPGSYNNFSEFSTFEVDYGGYSGNNSIGNNGNNSSRVCLKRNCNGGLMGKKIIKSASENNIGKKINFVSKYNSNLNSSILNTIEENNVNLIKDYTDKVK
jgi:hypothetical protein